MQPQVFKSYEVLEAEELARNKARVEALERELELTNASIMHAASSMHDRNKQVAMGDLSVDSKPPTEP